MYAIVESRGKQYKVSPGDELAVDLLKVPEGEPYTFDRVLMLVDDDQNVILDKSKLEDIKVTGVVTGIKKGKKLIVFKYKRRKDYHRKLGHRQAYTLLKVEDFVTPAA